MYGTGLLMSFSPCALSLLPLTIGYIIGTEKEGEEGGSSNAFLPSAAFAGGLATVLSVLGLSATYAGKLFGSTGLGGDTGGLALPLVSSVIAIAAGLNLLELLNFTLPSWEAGVESFNSLPRVGRAYALGASSALVASPCCTPVLASILGFVASSQDPALGLALLLAYSLGYTTPLMAAGTASGALSRIMSASGLTWITPVSAAALISYGTFTGLGAIFDSA
ncbi:cytochrome c biogenesis protein, thiol reduction transmembrane region, CcdA [Tribonema minus]|uniref:Cytochrome c biogenesis protein, thiol reduction transmembrane region, CcdA n=1 Tax=Tribonema minus TaxID=303371 RepID=A0A835YY77_9STRA|nr:cytochrome c biogenesis protein, thiol reduction transmembrane region, CcdA [Tribonema minus]